jgi:hypothetical protein
MRIKHMKSSFYCLFIVCLWTNLSTAQQNDRSIVKAWLTANKDQVTVLSLQEYQKMSPSVKVLLEKDSKVLIYDQQIGLDDIQKFESKAAVSINYQRLSQPSTQQTALQKQVVEQANIVVNQNNKTEDYGAQKNAVKSKQWLERHADSVQLITAHDYSKLSPAQRNKDMLVYQGDQVTLQDIKAFKAQR